MSTTKSLWGVLAALLMSASALDGQTPDSRSSDTSTAAAIISRNGNADASQRHRKPKIKGDFRPARSAAKTVAPRKAPSATPTIYAALETSYYEELPSGVYSFTPAEYALTPVHTDENLSCANGAAFADGILYTVSQSHDGYMWNTVAWTSQGPFGNDDISSGTLAVDPSTGELYGCVSPLSKFFQPWLAKINTDDFSISAFVGELSQQMASAFFGNDGTLYGIDYSGNLYTLDKTSGAATLSGPTGIDDIYSVAAAVDPASGACFVAVSGYDDGYLYELDLDACTSSLVYTMTDQEEIHALYILPPAQHDDAPANIDAPTLSFVDGSLSGTIAFTAPANTFGGATGSGELSYTLTINGVNGEPAAAQWGQTVTVPYTAPAPGQYNFSVTFSNAAGENKAAASGMWVGNDMPRPVTDVKVSRADGINTITWTPSQGSAHGGFLIQDQVRYRVTRNTDGTTVAENLTEPTCADNLPDGNNAEQVTYSVVAYWGEMVSETATSNRVMVGAAYFNGFDSAEDFDTMASSTLMRDGEMWEYNSYHHATGVSYEDEQPKSAWLSSPALTLQAGRTYTLSLLTWCSNEDYNEKLSVYIADTAEPRQLYGMTPIIDKATVNWEKQAAKTLSAEFTPTEAGQYYITINACSPADLGTLYVDDILLVAQPLAALPSKPEITGDVDDELLVSLSVTAPTTYTDGTALEALTSIVLSRDGVAVKTFETPAPGATLTFSEKLPGSGSYYYSAEAYVSHGHSEAATLLISAIEPSVPKAPSELKAVETSNDGEVTLSWSAPEFDALNNPLKPGSLTYTIYMAGVAEPLAAGLTATSHTFRAVPEGSQAFCSFRVSATNKAGEGSVSRQTETAAYGKADTLPYKESFSKLSFDKLWLHSTDDYSDASWSFLAASETPAATPADGDGGMLGFYGESLGEEANITSAKIYLGEGNNPQLTLWYFAQNKREGKDQLDILVDDGSGYTKIASFTPRDAQVDGWTKALVKLNAYAGKTIRLRLRGESFRTENFLLIDDVELTNIGTDLEALQLFAPSAVPVSQTFTVECPVRNNGGNKVAAYTVKLLLDGQAVAQDNGTDLASTATAIHKFTLAPDASWPETVAISFTVECTGDEVPANDKSAEHALSIIQNTFPTVSGLKATYTDDTKQAVKLTWTEPDPTTLPTEEFTENFEFFTPFEIDPTGDWTFVDKDGDITFGSQSYPFAGQNDPKAFVVLNADHFNSTYTAHSGKLYMAAYSAANRQSDDWMISPELTGDAQTIKFFARSYSDTYGLEQMEVLASSTGVDTEHFSRVKLCSDVPVEWTEYTVDLPAGTKHFAIRNISDKVFALFIDDVTFTPAVNPVAFYAVEGYNIYKDGQLLNDEPHNDAEYTDTTTGSETPTYRVSIVYDRGESPMSDAVTPSLSGVDGTTAQSVSINVTEEGVEIGTACETPVSVASPDGRTLFAGTISSKILIRLAQGLYIVKAGDETAKIIVK